MRLLVCSLSLGLVVAVGCAPSSAPSGDVCTSQCPGCCVGTVCHGGTDPVACGKGGASCQVCDTVAGQSCDTQSGACVNAGCPGCISGGKCQAGTDNGACGSGGLTCLVCAQHEFCQGGRCISQSSCGECPLGCCQGNQCVQGTANNACGSGGGNCIDCSQGGGVCDAASHRCSAAQTCANCPSGCCQGSQCMQGTAHDTCGTGNNACISCKAQGKICDAGSRSCVVGECASCTGCCWQDKCLPGNTNDRCGARGEPCFDCLATGLTCNYSKQQCQQPCADCLQGCCLGKICVAGTSDSACGNYGMLCQDCSTKGLSCHTDLRACANGCPNCPGGCCDGEGTCQSGDLDIECGTQGQTCINCRALGRTCHPVLKRCE